jgi:universal stress protein A
MLPRKILCPTDFSEPSYAALEEAITLAAHFSAELGLLHVVPYSPPPSPDLKAMVIFQPDSDRLADALARLRELAASRVPDDVKVHYEVKLGYPDREIARAIEAGNFDWLVIATHGFSGWKHLVFGSVAEAIVRRVRCPVLTVHPPSEPLKPQPLTPVRQEIGAAA